MTKAQFVGGLTRFANKVVFQLKNHSPEILVGAGIVTGVAGAVVACKATPKASDIVNEGKQKVNEIHQALEIAKEDPQLAEKHGGYTEKDASRELALTYLQTGIKFAKLYGPALLLGATSITCILAGTNILRARSAAIAAAYTALDSSFKEYRGNVIDRFGDAVDKELRYGLKTKTMEVITGKDEDGNDVVETQTVQVATSTNYGPFAVVFDKYCTGHTPDAMSNKSFLFMSQNAFNDRCKARGYLTVNDVYEDLGFEMTSQGALWGWVYDKDHPEYSVIDLGLMDIHRDGVQDFLNMRNPDVILDIRPMGRLADLLA